MGWPFLWGAGPSEVNIALNEVNLSTTLSSGLNAGVQASNIWGSRIAENGIDGGQLSGDYRAGIRFGEGNFNLLDCNSTSDMGNGIYVDAACEPSYLWKNAMVNNLEGLHLNYATLGHIGRPLSLGQDGQTWDNTWDNDVSAYDTYAANCNAGDYIIVYRTDAPSGINPAIYEPENNEATFGLFARFDTETGTNGVNMKFWQCAAEGSPNDFAPGGGESRSSLHRVLEDTSTANPYYMEQRWAGALNVYHALSLNDSLMLGDTVLTAFYDSCHTANIGKLYRAGNALYTGKDANKFIDTLGALSTAIVPEDAWRDVLLVAFEHTSDTTTVVDSLMFNIATVLDSIFPDSTFAAPRMKKRAWSSAHRSELESIAEECPYEYGMAVHMARAMLSQYDTIPYYAVHSCEQWAGPPSGKRDGSGQSAPQITEEDGMSFNLYPNPNMGEFTVMIGMEDADAAIMSVWSVTGQQVHSSMLSKGLNSLNLNVAAGLYLYVVTVNNELKWTGKVSINPY
jgi:hypothetical protein